MNSTVTKIAVQCRNVSNVRNFSQFLKQSQYRIPTIAPTLVINRFDSTRHNLVFNRRKVWYDPSKEPIGVYGWLLLGIPIITFGLGTWQVQRLKWKQDLMKQLETRTAAPPVDLPEDFNDLKDMEYCTVKMKGKFLHDKEFTIGPRSLIVDGAPATNAGLMSQGSIRTGYMVITPFKLEGRDDIILVNRGWVPAGKQSFARRQDDIIDGVVEISGTVRLNETRPQFVPNNKPMAGAWYYRDVNAMAKFAGTAPVYVDLVTKLYTKDGPIPGQTRVTLRNDHASYIFTWYSLSLFTGWMWWRMFVRKLPLL